MRKLFAIVYFNLTPSKWFDVRYVLKQSLQRINVLAWKTQVNLYNVFFSRRALCVF